VENPRSYSHPEKFSPGLEDLGIKNGLKTKEKSPNLLIPAQNGWKKLFWTSIVTV
jgi:hypothetical protein